MHTISWMELGWIFEETWHMRFIKLNITGSDKMRATGCMNAACKTRLMWNKNKIMPSVRGSQETSSRNLGPILLPHYVAFPITVWNSHYVISLFMSPILCHGWFPPSYRTNKTLQADFRPVWAACVHPTPWDCIQSWVWFVLSNLWKHAGVL